jgi:signal transduction histidine kinase
MFKNPFKLPNGSSQSPAPMLAVLVLAALVPAGCVLWFMTVAMRNERLAVQERLTEVYSSHLASLQRHVSAFAKERQAALQPSAGAQPSEIFASAVRSNLADSVVVYNAAGKVLYPAAPNVETPAKENADWARARELQAQAASLLKAGQKQAALQQLAALVGDPSLRGAFGGQGALIVPNAQLLILKTVSGAEASGPFAALRQQTLEDLTKRLNDYTKVDLASSQRRFLMAEVQALTPSTNALPMLAAEELSAEYLELDPAAPTESKLQRTPVAKVWRLPSADRTVVALFREERLRAEIAKLLDSVVLPDVRVAVLPPGEVFASAKLVASQDAGELLPGWRLGLSFRNGDPLAEASSRQQRFYLRTGFLVVLVIATLALLAARYVAAQMRLARLKNELVSTVSHELKTPLASMRALVDTLSARRYRDDGQLHEYLQLIAKENLRLSHLIENFLAFSRMERGQQQFHFEELPSREVVRLATEALGEKLAAPQCQLTTRLAPDLPPIHGDASALATVLINLLDNAHKYTDGDKRLEVRTHFDGDHVCFEVQDNGIGLDPAEVCKIFDRFYQVDQSLTRQRGGCGLGLSIVQSIVTAHAGTVEVESEPGKGSIFRVKIPAIQNHQIDREAKVFAPEGKTVNHDLS